MDDVWPEEQGWDWLLGFRVLDLDGMMQKLQQEECRKAIAGWVRWQEMQPQALLPVHHQHTSSYSL